MGKLATFFVVGLVAVAFCGCGAGENEGPVSCDSLPDGKIKQACIDKSAPKADRWDSQNDPQLFGVNLDYQLANLPQQGRVEQVAWPSTYWPTYEDSVNVRWQGQSSRSPLEKYDMAFNDWTPPADFDTLVPFKDCANEYDNKYYDELGPAAKYWSENHGNKAMRDLWKDPDGKCEEAIESWWGLCHAWVPAAILEPEPQKAVTYNGVTFEVSDVKALLIMAYNNSSSRFVGRRCNVRTDEIERDEYGRIKQDECRDSNPGTMHLILTNMIGRDKRAFAEDRTMNYEVWNQPVIGYEVNSMDEKTEEEAAKLIDPDCVSPCTYTWNTDAKKFFQVATDVHYVTESSPDTVPKIPQIDSYTRTDSYGYILELDGNGDIIGGEWLTASGSSYPSRFNSQMAHPDFFWLPLRAGSAPNRNASLQKIEMLVRMSQQVQPSDDGDAKIYKTDAKVSIPDNDSAGATASIDVGDDVTIASLKVTVNITHTYIGDLTLTLRHDGKDVELQKNAGGSTDNITKTFEVGDFSGSARGIWELVVVDNAGQDTGSIDSFELAVIESGGSGSTGETFTSSAALAIPDNEEDGVASTLSVPGSGVIKSVKIELNVNHTWISDLKIELRHGTGSSMLHNREGDDADNIEKSYSVDEFNGADSGGEWELFISDNAGQDTGTLNSWSLTIER